MCACGCECEGEGECVGMFADLMSVSLEVVVLAVVSSLVETGYFCTELSLDAPSPVCWCI